MTQRTWSIQIIGVFLLLLLIVLAIPIYTKSIPKELAQNVQNTLHANNLPWTRVQGVDRNIILRGNTPSLDEHKKAIRLTQQNWAVKSVRDEITPKLITPYTMSMQWNGKVLTLQGYLTSDRHREIFVQKAKEIFTNSQIEHRLQTALGAPKYWDELSIALLRQTKNLQLASINIVDKSISISGKAKSTKEITAVQQAIEPFRKQNYSVITQLISLDTPILVCQKKFNNLLTKEKIYFESGSSTISPKSAKLIKALSDTAALCSNAKISIIGYTDNQGSPTANLKLSEQRAKAVMAQLFRQGIPLERLKGIGKGATKPIAPNTTEEGKAKNRRIEFIVERI
ncbi:MAG TPA: hypothetical protein ENK52_02505 [Saprospiraceae bacterium]|nr:hypothetical protein [Saprospiraceae bacterium]